MNINFLSHGEPLSDAAIVQAEQRMQVRFPEDYRCFLKRFNGGEPEGHFFAIPSMANRSSVRMFYGINGDECFDLVRNWEVFLGRMPPNLIPIGDDAFGNLVVISVRGEDVGKVYYWDHDQETPWGEVADYRNMHEVAPSFLAFFDRMHNSDPNTVPLSSGLDAGPVWIHPDFLRELEENRKCKKKSRA